jgi:hypothetical protein
MTKNKEKAIPKWFKGEVYTEGDTVTNKFSGSSYDLSPHELSMYDFIMGSQLMMEIMPKMVTEKQINEFHKGLSWFRSANVDAYYVLLD